MNDELNTSAQYARGVGPKRFMLLNRLGIFTMRDILYYFPRNYEDRSKTKLIRDVEIGAVETVQGEIMKRSLYRASTGKQMLRATISDETGIIEVTWFNPQYVAGRVQRGEQVRLTGEVQPPYNTRARDVTRSKFKMVNPQFETESESETNPLHGLTILPVYPLTENLPQPTLRRIVKQIVDDYADLVDDMFGEDFLQSRDLMPLPEAIRCIHFPESLELLDRATRRLSYDEFLLLEMGLEMRRHRIKGENTGYRFLVTPKIDSHIRALFSFQLTSAQERAVAEIRKDMRSDKPMNRLLQGDVGSGKTAVAIYALLTAIANRKQAALMAPTEILAEQHFLTMKSLLAHARVKLLLLTGGANVKAREENLRQISAGEVDLVVGTHALIQQDVDFEELGLIVVDEQHKFGVLQRATLRKKGVSPDVLIMTATPIPRTLSLTVFGDLDVSIIDEMPPGRSPIKTYWTPMKKIMDAFEFIREKVDEGRQAYMVYPLVEESEKIDLKAATERAQYLQEKVFPELRVGLLHGRMKAEEKDEIMLQFRDGRYHILVATTVIEVGIDVPNATIMLIEHAERFGLAQLHQLRGRIGRGEHQSHCILFGNPSTSEGVNRLKILTQTTDGFEIAEKDLELRGPGEFFGTRQHGLPEIKIGDIIHDYNLLREAKSDAAKIVENDPHLELASNARIRERVMEKYEGRLDLINVG